MTHYESSQPKDSGKRRKSIQDSSPRNYELLSPVSEPASSIGSPVMQRSKSRKASFQRLHAEMSSPASASSSFQLSRRGSGDPHDAAADHSGHLSFDNEVRFL